MRSSLKIEQSPRIKEIIFILTRMRENPLSIVGLAIVISFAIIAISAHILAPPVYGRDPYIIPRSGYYPEPQPPSPEHPFGTTQGQYDLYYGIIWGTRAAYRIGVLVVAASAVIGIAVGSLAGYYKGFVDEILMRITDIILAFPSLILAMALVVAFGPGLDSITLALILVGWPGYARLVRGEFLRISAEDFVEAAKAIGSSDLRVIIRHILPNAIFPLLVYASLDIGSIILVAAALSFLGLGPPEGYADWGQLISLSRNWITGTSTNPFAYWHVYTIPGLFLFLFVMGWNLLGDALRDALDPMLRRR
ncbi:MAG: ABC transporter permease [Thaumarchaeota archaeon]|jgi:peptide/nickel transport system permease protein|nr:ABC transporter permease [Candidatus Terraquivivens yellowstonensis]